MRYSIVEVERYIVVEDYSIVEHNHPYSLDYKRAFKNTAKRA